MTVHILCNVSDYSFRRYHTELLFMSNCVNRKTFLVKTWRSGGVLKREENINRYIDEIKLL